jgi:hypothetical protein
MSRISELGDRVLNAQSELGLANPAHYRPGLTEHEKKAYPFLANTFNATELADLFAWKNGLVSNNTIPLLHLWITPGFFLLSAQEVEEEHQYFKDRVPNWDNQWYPLLSEGTADRLFVDGDRIKGTIVPVFYAFWESPRQTGQIYDSIESMLNTTLQCYLERAYYLEGDGALGRNFSQEIGIARPLNPFSDYWSRTDLE